MASSEFINKVEVLFDGFSRMEAEGSSVMYANCSCSLVIGEDVKIIVDTMTPWDGPRLLNALAKRGITPDEITHAVATHGHSDHIGNLNHFLKAKHIIGTSMNYGEIYYDVLQNGTSLKLARGIEVVPTPGHTASCVTVIALGTEKGTIAITGDLFETRQDVFDPHIWEHQAGSENPVQQAQNRQKVLRIANYIIPGHGPMFEVTEEMRSFHDNYVRQMRSQYMNTSLASVERLRRNQELEPRQPQKPSDSGDDNGDYENANQGRDEKVPEVEELHHNRL
ncbi:metallo-beta-lactamase domain-containing protein 1-like [Varroa destructor]|uniref:Metallo-beta-lactamase domain-containing protein 1 n=1 Tax=Varroa destructor TaxID=109461 RepID=A0A7M7J7A8_VARDE|nr:metallo-beta-lactamase domain-containing protein 1-like [Varroa destructor]XP_022647846.1 metallo-beta-lactamase domain-containing protein 1-like [Varroa destructor]XP_022647847.1 metallo-beta-lactamase domain-containing protein 1-like [Varroa destructor]XP_022647848.1 metallo-beta-lactamase domain-containing protein 1-like [Varroa destructor]XP_022647849.1 metallo-beta-lactamase domain-containing protein 1-like [Varroa destructor]